MSHELAIATLQPEPSKNRQKKSGSYENKTNLRRSNKKTLFKRCNDEADEDSLICYEKVWFGD